MKRVSFFCYYFKEGYNGSVAYGAKLWRDERKAEGIFG